MPSAKLFCACVIRLDRPRPGVPLASTGKPRFRGVFNPFYLFDAVNIAHSTNAMIIRIIEREAQSHFRLALLAPLHAGQRSRLSCLESGGRACLRQLLRAPYILRASQILF